MTVRSLSRPQASACAPRELRMRKSPDGFSCSSWFTSRNFVCARSRTSCGRDARGHHAAWLQAYTVAGAALKDVRPRGARQRRDRAILRRHRDPVSVSAITAGLQAIGSRITAKPSRCADHEGVEAIEVLQPALAALLSAYRPRAMRAMPDRRRHLVVVVGLEALAMAHQLLAQVTVIGQRAVVHQAGYLSPVENGMRSRDR